MTGLSADFDAILDGQADGPAITDFLVRSMAWMGDAEALVTGARALRARMVCVNAPSDAMDVCGTGGDGAHTLNISTAVSFVVAGCGAPVAKHGNRAMSSKSGAADVLEALGVKLTGDVETLQQALREAGVAFLFAQIHHPAMRHVAAARRALGQRTIFNLLGPLANPAGVLRQLVGVFDADYAAPMADALVALGAERAIVVHGAGGLDELSGEGGNVMEQRFPGASNRLIVHAVEADCGGVANAALRGGDAAFNAGALRALLDGDDPDPDYREVVVLNAAASLLAAGRCSDLREGALQAREALASGAAARALDRLIAITQGAPNP